MIVVMINIVQLDQQQNRVGDQGRRQEFFQRRVPGKSRGGLLAIIEFPGVGGGAQPRFLVASMVKIKTNFRAGAWPSPTNVCLRLCWWQGI